MSVRKKKDLEPIAIVGIGCNFPGGAHGPDKFWKLLVDGGDAIVEVPSDRWSMAYFDPEPGKPSKTYSKWGGFVPGINLFDPVPFGFPAREVEMMDPQQRLILESTWEAMEDAGMPIDTLRPRHVGVFVGISTYDYALIQCASSEFSEPSPYSATGTSLSIAANRISYCFNFTGPSMSIDTACSSALTALDMACRSIWNGECEAAVAGGVNALLSPGTYLAFCTISMLSPDGRCKAFDQRANGFVRSEGSGVVVLKPLSAARASGDRIYAVIRGTGTNQDGRTTGMTVPNAASQERLIRRVCEVANIDPQRVGYVEAHGTGTAVGDPIEAKALGGALGVGRTLKNRCRIGSVKTNLGHLEAGSGAAGLIKTALSLYHGLIPPSLHFETPNPAIDFEALRLRVVTECEPFGKGQRVAGLNSFGFGGTNAHALLEAMNEPGKKNGKSPRGRTKAKAASENGGLLNGTGESAGPAQILVLSAKDEPSLKFQAGNWATHLETTDESLTDICRAAATDRAHFEARVSAVANSPREMAALLADFAKDEKSPFVVSGQPADPQKSPGVVFVYSGQGPQWWAMGRELWHEEPVFREKIEECAAALRAAGGWNLRKELLAAENESRMAETEIAQPAITAIQIALTGLWASWGIKPAVVVGHSVGEVAAAYAAGVYSLREAMRVIYQRGRCMEQKSRRGKMIAAGISASEAAQAIQPFGERLSLAAINSPVSVSISGDAEAVEEIAARLEKQGKLVRTVPVNYAFHSAHMDPVRDELVASLKGLRSRPAKIPIYSTVSGDLTTGREMKAVYWWRNVREPVQFAPAIGKLAASGFDLFLEVGPHPALSGSIRECLAPIGPGETLPSLRRQKPERATLLTSLGALHAKGVPIDWAGVMPGKKKRISLPTYHWKKEPFWHEPPVARENRIAPSTHPLLFLRQRHPNRSWEGILDRRAHPWLNDHRVLGHMVFPGAGYTDIALSFAMEAHGTGAVQLEDVEFVKPLFIPASGEYSTIRMTHSAVDSGYRINSRRGDITSEWIFHSSGKHRPLTKPAPVAIETPEAIRARCHRNFKGPEFYDHMAGIGLPYGPMFQGVQQVWYRRGEAIAEIVLPKNLEGENHRYAFHPAMLDACIQITTNTHYDDAGETRDRLRLPVSIERFRYYRHPGTRIWCHATLVRDSADAAIYNCVVYTEQGEVVAEATGMKGHVMQGGSSSRAPVEKLLYEQEWQLAPLANHTSKSRPADFFPEIAPLVSELREFSNRRTNELGLQARFAEVKPRIDKFCAALFEGALAGMDATPQPGERFTLAELVQRCGIAPAMVPVAERLLAHWAQQGGIRRNDDEGETKYELIAAPAVLGETDLATMWREVLNAFPALLPDLILLDRCGQSLARILRGEETAREIIAPNGSTNQLEHYEAKSFRFRVPHELVRIAIADILRRAPEGRRVRILEVKAGTGGLTAEIAPALQEGLAEYAFTDATSQHFPNAEQKFRSLPFLKCEVFDPNGDASRQAFPGTGFDIIVSSKPLSSGALAELRTRLAPGGLLIMENVSANSSLDTFTFGLIPEVREESIDVDSWESLLSNSGFESLDLIPGADHKPLVILARASEVAALKFDAGAKSNESDTKQQKPWLILEDQRGWGKKIADALKLRDQACFLVSRAESFSKKSAHEFTVSASSTDDMSQLLMQLPAVRGILHLWSLDAESDESILTADDLADAEVLTCHATLHLIQALQGKSASVDPQLWLITSGAQPAGKKNEPLNVAQAPLIGLGRNIANEWPELRCRLVDLSRHPGSSEIECLVDELFADESDAEEEISLREEARYRQRLTTRHDHADHAPKELVEAAMQSFRLDVVRGGSIDGISYVSSPRRAPGPGEIEIEVHAAGLNFRDVMKSLGIYPSEDGDPQLLGDECSGRVVRVGQGVTDFKPGDDVMTMGTGCFASHVIQNAAAVLPKPAGFSFEEAATVLTCYITAHYALRHLGHMRSGESVFVHAAAGGVGLAAVQLALSVGAKVYATAGSPEKRRVLELLGVEKVFDSRSLDFADEILEETQGRGVDLVLNSLAGEAISRSLSVLAPGGRFLEIGKRDIYQDTQIGLRPFRKNLSYFAIDLGRAFAPEMIDVFLAELKKLFASPHIRPLPHRVFPASEAVEAFRHMTQAKQIGKIVLDFRNARVPLTKINPRCFERCKADATYLIVGGVGGFGLASAQSLVANGARCLVLASRNASPTPEAQAIIGRMESAGVRVVLAKCDVSNDVDAGKLIADIKANLPPLRGISHSAMVLDDGLLVQMTAERFRKVLASKVQGAWNLHRLTKDLPLDNFVLYSSSSSTIGNPGQSNYCAANAFLDALAHLRRRLNLPSLTVNWGLLAEVGVITRDAKLAEHFRRLGLEGLSTRTALGALGYLMMEGSTQTTVWSVDWNRWIEAPVHYAKSKRYSLLTTADVLKQNQRDAGEQLRASLNAASPAERVSIAQNCLRQQIAEVLRVPAAKIDLERPLNEQGMDSLMAVELMHRLDSDLGVSISPTKLVGKPTIVKLAQSVLEVLGKAELVETAVESTAGAATQGPREISGAIDYRKEVCLPDEFSAPSAPLQPDQYENPRQIILTGAFEYLGLHLLHDLLAGTSARVICFASATDKTESARQHLFDVMAQRKLKPKDTSRIVVQAVDFAQPRFGLPPSEYDRLASESDLIIHNFAEINHIAPYEQLKPANVGATLEVIRFASHGRLKPIHYVSSLTVFGAGRTTGPTGREDDPLDNPEALPNGYDASRWIAEKCLGLAKAAGVPVTIYRPGLMWGDSTGSISTPDDFVWRFVLSCLATERGPRGAVDLFVTPVDFVSRAICALLRKSGSLGQIFHAVSPFNYRLEDLFVLARQCGYPVELVSRKEWEAGLHDKAASGAVRQLLPYLMFRGVLWMTPEESEPATPVDSSHLRAALEGTDVTCPPVTPELMQKYLEGFVALNLLPQPRLLKA